MDHNITIRLTCDGPERESLANVVRDALRESDTVVRSETRDAGDEHGIVEVAPALAWLAATASGITASVLAAMIYDRIRHTRPAAKGDADRTELRVTRRRAEIVDPSSGARLTFEEEVVEISAVFDRSDHTRRDAIEVGARVRDDLELTQRALPTIGNGEGRASPLAETAPPADRPG